MENLNLEKNSIRNKLLKNWGNDGADEGAEYTGLFGDKLF